MNNNDCKTDDYIRSALRKADSQEKLSVIAAISGVPDAELRRIMNGSGEMSMADRAALGVC